MRHFVQYGAVPVKAQIAPTTACKAAIARGEYPDLATCFAAAKAGVVIPPAPVSPPSAAESITGSPVVKYAGIALAAAVVLGGGYLLFKKDRTSMTPNRGPSRRQSAARRGARTRAAGGTKRWSVVREGRTVGTLELPNWMTLYDAKDEAKEQFGEEAYPVVRVNGRRRRRRSR